MNANALSFVSFHWITGPAVVLVGASLALACSESDGGVSPQDGGGLDRGAAGASGTSGTGGAGEGGSGGSGGSLMPYPCAGVRPPSAAITDFSGTDPRGTWGDPSSGFSGGMYVYGDADGDLAADLTGVADLAAKNFHVTGQVGTYSGFGIYFSQCANASQYKGISFKLTGTTTGSIVFYLLINETSPIDPINMIGACSFTSEQTKYVECVNPSKVVTPTGNVTFLFSDLTGGKPRALDPEQIHGMSWALVWAPGVVPYSVDLRLDDVAFVGDGAPMAGSPGSD
ncbi:MAG TPA: hypothetical protein VF881_00670 [Polyangiaceae bacterium]